MRLSRERPPAEVTDRFDRDERVLAWGRTDTGAAIVASQRGLWLPAEAGHRLLRWHLIDKAAWTDGTLTVTEARPGEDGVVDELPPVTWAVADPRKLPATIRTRVTRSVAFTEHTPVETGGVRVVARRVAGQDGLAWTVRYDEGTDTSAPQVRERAAELLADAQQRLAPPV